MCMNVTRGRAKGCTELTACYRDLHIPCLIAVSACELWSPVELPGRLNKAQICLFAVELFLDRAFRWSQPHRKKLELIQVYQRYQIYLPHKPMRRPATRK